MGTDGFPEAKDTPLSQQTTPCPLCFTLFEQLSIPA